MRCRIASIILFFLIACQENGLLGQISGVIYDEQGIALEGVHIWLSGTQSGDYTDSQGAFQLDISHSGPIGIVASHIGYKVYKQSLTRRDTARSLNIKLRSASLELDEVLVTAQASKKRKKWLRQFEQAFFGNTQNAESCELLNPDVLLFEKTQSGLKVISTDVVRIRNKALGYDVYLQLDHAMIVADGISYSGRFLFEEMDISDGKAQSQIARARRVAYLGSRNHFFRSLIADALRENKFKISEVQVVGGQVSDERPRSAGQILQLGSVPGEYILQYDDLLKVLYFGEEDPVPEGEDQIGSVARTLGRPAEQDMISQEKNLLRQSQSGQISYLFLKKVPVLLLEGGYLKKPKYLEEHGYLSKERFAEMLPFEYGDTYGAMISDKKRDRSNTAEVSKKNKAMHAVVASDASIVNGFALTNLKIDEGNIKSGGPPRDGIRAIDHPLFVKASEQSDMEDDEMVLGLVVGSRARAYPTRILDRHEIVNDVIDQVPVAISYCPLCNSGIAFERNVIGITRTFGVSGLLYNSDVLMFDRESESLWSQIMGEAISGELSGSVLETLPVIMSSWGLWKSQHPETEVLIGGQGLSANYKKGAYAQYRTSQALMFPVVERSNELDNKDMVIGIELDGKSVAYPYKVLAEEKMPLIDEFNGQILKVHYNKAGNTAWITDEAGKLLAAESMYWFAWYAFHTQTMVYR